MPQRIGKCICNDPISLPTIINIIGCRKTIGLKMERRGLNLARANLLERAECKYENALLVENHHEIKTALVANRVRCPRCHADNGYQNQSNN